MHLTVICAIFSIFVPYSLQNEDDLKFVEHSLSTEQNTKRTYNDNHRRVIKHTHRGMIQALCKHGHIYSESVRNAMLRVDRKNFFPKPVFDPYHIKSRQIGFGADISSPHIHAQMLELLKDKIKPGARILDIGSGSGYLTACLAYLAGPTGRVFGVEHVMELAEGSIKNIDKGNSELLDQGRVQFVVWNGKHGYEREAPYDIIHVSPSYFTIPQKLLDQLVPGGRMLMPVGEPFKAQNLTIIDKLADGYTIVTTVVRPVRTNPLYRDRFQQRKYYSELRRKAALKNNETETDNSTSVPLVNEKKVSYVFQKNEEIQEEGKPKTNGGPGDQSESGHVWNPDEENHRKEEPQACPINRRKQKEEPQACPINRRKQSQDKGGEEPQACPMPRRTPKNEPEPEMKACPLTTSSKPEMDTTAFDSDYEMRSTTQWRWRHYYTWRTNNWVDYDEGFDRENPYNIDGVDHGIKLDHTAGGDYVYPDPSKMTHFPKDAHLWGNCEEYKKWYNANYIGQNTTPLNKVLPAEITVLPTKKAFPPGLLEDMRRDSFPDNLFPLSDYLVSWSKQK